MSSQKTVDHWVSACSALASSAYAEHHNCVMTEVYFAICRDMKADGLTHSVGGHRQVSVSEGQLEAIKWK